MVVNRIIMVLESDRKVVNRIRVVVVVNHHEIAVHGIIIVGNRII